MRSEFGFQFQFPLKYDIPSTFSGVETSTATRSICVLTLAILFILARIDYFFEKTEPSTSLRITTMQKCWRNYGMLRWGTYRHMGRPTALRYPKLVQALGRYSLWRWPTFCLQTCWTCQLTTSDYCPVYRIYAPSSPCQWPLSSQTIYGSIKYWAYRMWVPITVTIISDSVCRVIIVGRYVYVDIIKLHTDNVIIFCHAGSQSIHYIWKIISHRAAHPHRNWIRFHPQHHPVLTIPLFLQFCRGIIRVSVESIF